MNFYLSINMEIEINDFIENENTIDTIYELDFENQNLENNLKYQKWKKVMLDKYGNNIKIFKCNYDRILFCIKDCELKENIPYFKKCPKCKNYICYFCSYYSSKNNYNSLFCCFKREISTYSDKTSDSVKKDFYNNCWDFISFLIPGLSFANIIMFFFNILCLDLASKKSKANYKGELENPMIVSTIDLILFQGYLYLYVLIYFIFNIFMIIFTLLISIPFKFYPIKYIISLSLLYA